MAKFIDADMLKPDMKIFTSAYSTELKKCYSQEAIDRVPAADVQEVRHGKWFDNKHTDTVICSQCKKCFGDETPYCPCCGARMDGEI